MVKERENPSSSVRSPVALAAILLAQQRKNERELDVSLHLLYLPSISIWFFLKERERES